MKKLLIFETHKLLRQKSYYITLGVMVVLLFLMTLIRKFRMDMSNISGYTCVDSLLDAAANVDFAMVNGIFIALLVCNDFVGETVKNIYARGFSKTKVFLSKLAVALAASAVQFVCVILFGLIFGAIFFGGGAFGGKTALLLFGQLLACLSTTSFAFALSYVFKKTGVSIALSILGTLIIELVLSVMTVLFKIETFALSDYWISSFLTSMSDTDVESKRTVICFVLSVVYAAVFVAAAWLLDRKHDV